MPCGGKQRWHLIRPSALNLPIRATWHIAKPESLYPETAALKSTRPTGSGDLALNSPGHINSVYALGAEKLLAMQTARSKADIGVVAQEIVPLQAGGASRHGDLMRLKRTNVQILNRLQNYLETGITSSAAPSAPWLAPRA